MKINNLEIKKAAFSIGLSFILMGCSNTKVETASAKTIEEVVNIEIDNNETNSIRLEENNTINIDIETLEYKENSYTTSNLNLRENPNLESNVITVIDKCQKIMEIENLDDWSYVMYGENVGYVYNEYIKSLPDNYIEVDISDQNIKYRIGENVIVDSNIVTGKQNVSDTRIGMFEIYSRETARFLTGRDAYGNITYSSYVDYWMPFDGGIGLHDASWRNEFGGDIYITSGSHGCVNLPLDIAKTIYENSEVGTKVLVHK